MQICRKLFRFLLDGDLLDHHRISASPEPSPCVEISPKCGGVQRKGKVLSLQITHTWTTGIVGMIDERQARERGHSNEKPSFTLITQHERGAG